MSAERIRSVRVDIAWNGPQRVILGISDAVLIPRARPLPGVYRFRLTERSGTTWVYFGETVNLARRMTQYAKPGPTQRTNQRMNARFRGVLAERGTIDVSIADTIIIQIDGEDVVTDLTHQWDRRLAENAAIVAARFEGVDHIENVDHGHI